MILTFPDFDVLRLALTSGAIPARVSLAPARATSDGLVVEPSLALDDTALAELRRLRVTIARSSAARLDLAVVCWPQLLPLERDAAPHATLDNTPILFEISDTGKLPELVSEMLRLGNDRQSFRWFESGGVQRAFVRVIGPPYYSLLRALDDPDNADIVAYCESGPRIWTQLGWTHPLSQTIHAPAGQMLLMRRPRSWTFIDEGRFRDIYEVLDFTLPAEPMAWREVEQATRIQVPVRLATSGSVTMPELWVLHEDALAQIDSLVQNADDQLISRLTFAVAERDGNTMVVLRVRPSKEPPPVLVLNAIGFRPYLNLANLFVPHGQRLHPPLRRDAVAKLLVRDSKHVTWLFPADASFTPESLPETAFRPLSQWVDYVIDREHVALTAWVNAHRFDFERFVCTEDKPAPKPPGPKERKPRKDADDVETSIEAGPVLEVTNKSRTKKKQDKPLEALASVEPSQLEHELIELEAQFVALKTPLDHPERQALWPRIARLYAALGNADDAAISCGNALWEAEPPAMHDWLRECRANDPAWSTFSKIGMATILSVDEWKTADLRVLVLSVLGAASAEELAPHLGRIQQQLEKHEQHLGVRLVWLAWEAVHRLAHGDVLALARARDRLLERLYLTGLSPDLDLPGFLRVAGAMSSDRYRRVRDHLTRMRPMVSKWIVGGVVLAPDTECYVDMMFAYAFAQLGEPTQSQKLMREAHEKVTRRDDVNNWLLAAFEFRINEALDGKRGANRLPAPMLETLGITDRLARYKIDRLREHSRILEPHEKIDPYRRWHGRFADDLSRELALLFDIEDRAKLAKRLGNLLSPKPKNNVPEPRVYATALELAPRLGESFASDLLYQVEQSFAKTNDPVDLALLIERSLFLAAHYDKKEEVQDLVARFHTFLAGKGSDLPSNNLETLLGATFRGLRKLGLREEAARLLAGMAAVIQARESAQSNNPEEQGKEMGLLLQVTSGWLYFGDIERARTILDSARSLLFDETLSAPARTQLACAYASALAQAPVELSVPRVLELFRKLTGIQDAFTTNSHYSLSRLDVIEAAILALVTDDFKVSPEARRWLDDDEFLVRRRIHHTMRTAMGNAGL